MFSDLFSALRGAPRTRDQYAWFTHEQPLAFAHRGGMLVWPENTRFAFDRAASAGVDGFEMDVHRTRDGEIVVCHDPTVDRTTDGHGAITDLTLAEVQSLDAGYRWSSDGGRTFPYRGKGIQIPALQEIFEAHPEKRYIIDNKPTVPEMALQLAELAVACGVAGRVCLASFHAPNVYAIRARFPEIATSCSEPEVRAFGLAVYSPLHYLYRPPAPCFQVPPRHGAMPVVNRRFMNIARRKGMEVHVWTVNDPEEMQRLISLGVRAIISDFPERVVEVLKRG